MLTLGYLDKTKLRKSYDEFVRNPASSIWEGEFNQTVINDVRLTPSACNSQPWKFVIIDDTALVKQVGAMIANNPLGINKFAETAPVLVAVVEEPAVLMAKADGKGSLYSRRKV